MMMSSIATSCIAPPTLPKRELIRAATLAPSADNNQPWRFQFDDQHRLIVEHDPSRALPSDIDRMFDLQALGAAIENICIAARQHGFAGRVTCLAGSAPAVARIEFLPGAQPDPLFPSLAERCTCRRAYSRRPVANGTLSRLADAASAVAPDVRVDWITARSQIRRMARLVAASDRGRFEYRAFHAELYRQLRFSAADVERARDGLDVRLLALPPGGSLVLRMLRSWNTMSLLNRFGLSRLLTLSSALAVWQSGGVGAISVTRDAPADFLAAGRAFERLWLAAAREMVAIHPLGSLPILLRRLERGSVASGNRSDDRSICASEGSRLSGSDAQRAEATAADQHMSERIKLKLCEIIPAIAGRQVTMFFRIGYAPAEALKSLRRPPEDVLA
jgi:nitroreductase